MHYETQESLPHAIPARRHTQSTMRYDETKPWPTRDELALPNAAIPALVADVAAVHRAHVTGDTAHVTQAVRCAGGIGLEVDGVLVVRREVLLLLRALVARPANVEVTLLTDVLTRALRFTDVAHCAVLTRTLLQETHRTRTTTLRTQRTGNAVTPVMRAVSHAHHGSHSRQPTTTHHASR